MGPPGAALEANVLALWRKHFVVEDSMLEVRSCQLTPHQALEASGHVDKFADVMVRDTITNEYFRADHLVKGNQFYHQLF